MLRDPGICAANASYSLALMFRLVHTASPVHSPQFNIKGETGPVIKLLPILLLVVSVGEADGGMISPLITFDSGPGANGHFYQLVTYQAGEDNRWTVARDQAASLGGYLVTITSQAENDFLFTNYATSPIWSSVWIGASDAANEGEWKWVVGPEAGTQFWTGGPLGSTVGGQFANWGSSEPNEHPVPGGEDYGVFAIGSVPTIAKGEWGDANDIGTNAEIVGYIVEYNTNPVPEPSSLVLLGMGGLSLFGCGWRRQRQTDLVA